MAAKIALCSLLLIILAAFGQAQKYDYGRPSEMKGLTKLYIDTRADFKDLERITTEFKKQKVTNVVLVDRLEDAEMVLLYQGEQEDRPVISVDATRSNTTFDADATFRTIPLITGQGMVFVLTKGKPRLVFKYENQQETQWEQKPTTKLVKVFARAYRDANGLK